MKRCSDCGGPVNRIIPPGDDRPRFVCRDCGMIHYQNPRMVVGCIPNHEGRILLCRRAIDPCRGTWTFPAGYLENGETVNACAKREAWEEAGIRLNDMTPYLMFNICHIHQLYLIFRGRLIDTDFQAGAESSEVNLFSEAEIPWKELSFPVIRESLRRYFEDRVSGRFPFGIHDILPSDSFTSGYCGSALVLEP